MTNGLIAVSRASGGIGRRVARRLADRGLPQRLIARDPARLEVPPAATLWLTSPLILAPATAASRLPGRTTPAEMRVANDGRTEQAAGPAPG